MPALPGTSGEAERVSQEGQGVPVQHWVVWFVWLVGAFVIVGGTVVYVWGSDESRLVVLHRVIKMLQEAARIFGSLALYAESAYNDIVDQIH